MKTIILHNKRSIKIITDYLSTLPLDGSRKVTISGSMTKTEKQRQLDWKWDEEILKSGIGWDDKDKETVHARGKWMFARPILLEDDELFMSIYSHFMDSWANDQDKCLEFARDYISTQRMSTHQVWRYMTDKQRYWTAKGVNLTDPEDLLRVRE